MKTKKELKAYVVTYGNDAWRNKIGVYAENEKEAIKTIEKELRKGIQIIKVELMEE